jgi:hypothetical protein
LDAILEEEKDADCLDDDTTPKRTGVIILETIPKGRVVLNNEAMQELACHSMDSPRS